LSLVCAEKRAGGRVGAVDHPERGLAGPRRVSDAAARAAGPRRALGGKDFWGSETSDFARGRVSGEGSPTVPRGDGRGVLFVDPVGGRAGVGPGAVGAVVSGDPRYRLNRGGGTPRLEADFSTGGLRPDARSGWSARLGPDGSGGSTRGFGGGGRWAAGWPVLPHVVAGPGDGVRGPSRGAPGAIAFGRHYGLANFAELLLLERGGPGGGSWRSRLTRQEPDRRRA